MRRQLTEDSGYNPPQFVIDAAKDALNKVECNQYSPTKVHMDVWTVVGMAKDFLGSTAVKESNSGFLLTILWQRD